MDGGVEVDTWPILEDLLSRGVTCAIPRVTGKSATNMYMLRIESLEQAKGLPRTKWGIPEPDEATASLMEDLTPRPFDLVLVPGVAFDARCQRLGRGKGYYDAFLQQQRATGEAVTAIGLALAPQIISEVPVTEQDQRLDMVVHPGGRLSYASQADVTQAAQLKDTAPRESKRARTELDIALGERVKLSEGRYKYACLQISNAEGSSCLAVRSAPGDYHAEVADPYVAKFESKGYCVEPLGGGRIIMDSKQHTVHIYGYSVGFGGAEGGPPGHAMVDHSEVAAIVRQTLPDYTVTFSPEGY